MTGHFLDRLAARALGGIPLAEPALGSRFGLGLVAASEPPLTIAAESPVHQVPPPPLAARATRLQPVAAPTMPPDRSPAERATGSSKRRSEDDGGPAPILRAGLNAQAERIVDPVVAPAAAWLSVEPAQRSATAPSYNPPPINNPPVPTLSLDSAARPAIGGGLAPPPRDLPVAHEPVVHVTIGRVDVRAIQEPAPVQRRREARPPNPTLADYLARRNRDGRDR